MVSNVVSQVAKALLTACLSLLGCVLLLAVAGTLYLASKARWSLFEAKSKAAC
jgi:hypothetical protein